MYLPHFLHFNSFGQRFPHLDSQKKQFVFLDLEVGTTTHNAEVTRLDARIRGADLWAPVHRGYPRDDDMAAGSAPRARPKLITVNSHRFPNWAPSPKT